MTVLIAIVLVALIFDFLNGFHDAANSIATVVSTRVLSPQQAVAWAAFFNFVAAFVLGTHVAKTIGKGMIDLSVVTSQVILAGLGAPVVDRIPPTSPDQDALRGLRDHRKAAAREDRFPQGPHVVAAMDGAGLAYGTIQQHGLGTVGSAG